MKRGPSPQSTDQTTVHPPSQGDRALVQCENYRCLAVSDGKGKWIDYYTQQELKDVKEVVLRLERRSKAP